MFLNFKQDELLLNYVVDLLKASSKGSFILTSSAKSISFPFVLNKNNKSPITCQVFSEQILYWSLWVKCRLQIGKAWMASKKPLSGRFSN